MPLDGALRFPLLGLGVLLSPCIASADETADARGLYDQGAAAYDAGDYARAASQLADADALSPNPTVLALALRAADKAGDAVLAEELALRVDTRAITGDLATAAAQAHDRYRAKVGRVRVVCGKNVPSCTARIGSTHWAGGELHAVAPGRVDVSFDGVSAHVRIEVAAGAVADLVQPAASPISPVSPALPVPLPPAEPPTTFAPDATVTTAGGLSPWVFWTGVAVTGVLGVATSVSAADTQSRYNTFVGGRTTPNQQAGESAELRTNVLFATAVGIALVTAAIGVFDTRWHTSTLASLASGRVSF